MTIVYDNRFLIIWGCSGNGVFFTKAYDKFCNKGNLCRLKKNCLYKLSQSEENLRQDRIYIRGIPCGFYFLLFNEEPI